MNKEDSEQEGRNTQQESANREGEHEYGRSAEGQQKVYAAQQERWWRQWRDEWNKWTRAEKIQGIQDCHVYNNETNGRCEQQECRE